MSALAQASVTARRTASAVRPTKGAAAPLALPSGEESSLALGLTPAGGLDCSESAQAEAMNRFRSLIEPVVNAERQGMGVKPASLESIRLVAAEAGVSVRTVQRALSTWRTRGIAGLSRRIRADRGESRVLNEAAREFLLSASLPSPGSYGEFAISDVYRLYEEERRFRAAHETKPLCPAQRARYARYIGADGCFTSAAQLPTASYRSFCREVAKIPEPVRKMASRGDDAYRNSELVSHRDIASVAPLDYVVMDHRVLDIFCIVESRRGLHRTWQPVRPWLTAAIDMRTRRFLAWTIVETPSSHSIATVLKRVFIECGVPRALYWDNGKDFRCQWLEGRSERTRAIARADSLPARWTGVLETLGIRVHHAIVKNARAKLIEPAFGAVADFDRTLPEWCGHKPGSRPERFERMVEAHEAWLAGRVPSPAFRPIEEIARLYDQLFRDLNERPHTGDGMRKVTPTGYGWMCPNEAWEILISRVERKTIPDAVLQLCFAKRRELVVRNGEVKVTHAGQVYRYRLVGNRMGLLGLNGRTVELACDPLDLSKSAIYYQASFVGLAECIELRRMGDGAFVQDERDRRAARREVKRFIENVHRAVPVADPEEYLRRRQGVLPARVEPERLVSTVTLPAAIEAAARATAEEEDSFSFAGACPAIEASQRQDDTTDSEFHFFSDQQGEA